MDRRTELKKHMELTGKTKVDIASALKVDPITVVRYLDGRPVRPIVEAAISRLLDDAKSSPAGKIASG